jgi:hypothetical protein
MKGRGVEGDGDDEEEVEEGVEKDITEDVEEGNGDEEITK